MNKLYYKIFFYIIWGFFTYLFLKNNTNQEITILENLNIKNIDKLAHILIFILLSYFFNKAFKITFINTFLILAIYGIIIEYLQDYLPINRTFEIYDWFADLIGILLGIILYKSNFINKILQVKN